MCIYRLLFYIPTHTARLKHLSNLLQQTIKASAKHPEKKKNCYWAGIVRTQTVEHARER